MKSILQDEKKCFVCGCEDVQCHHIYFGPKRRKSERNGFKVWLCWEHHLGTIGVHGRKGHDLDEFLKKECQRKFEETHTREEFMKIIGCSYL